MRPISRTEPQLRGGRRLGARLSRSTDRSTNIYITERGSGALELDQDVRHADGTHGWQVEQGRRLDDRHFEFDLGGGKKERCEIATSCDRIDCTSFALIHHFCSVDGDWRATFAHRTGTARVTSHRDDLDVALVGEHAQQLKGLRFSARNVMLHFPEGEVRCDISETCDHIGCATFELSR